MTAKALTEEEVEQRQELIVLLEQMSEFLQSKPEFTKNWCGGMQYQPHGLICLPVEDNNAI